MRLCKWLVVVWALTATVPVLAEPPASTSAPSDAYSLKTDRINTQPLTYMEGQPTPSPQSPPRTVEGTLKAVEPGGQWILVTTKSGDEVRIGIPPNLECPEGVGERSLVHRNGRYAKLADGRVGDRVFVTVVNSEGLRALHVVFQTPPSPLLPIIGIPLLAILALGIYAYERKVPARNVAPPKAGKGK
jgi:hypothetical protein